MNTRFENWFLRLAVATVVLLYLVVVAGSVVRATGSGMGCPDWPKCFGKLIPPTEAAQVPAEYVKSHPTFKIEDFNVAKTWTEYINRLLGATSGFFLLGTLLISALRWKWDRGTPLILFSTMVLASVVIWLGKKVVDEELDPRQVTIHMLGGLALVMGSVIAATRVRFRIKRIPSVQLPRKLYRLLWISLIVVVAQVLVGTQMREGVDRMIESGECCNGRIESTLGGVYSLHRLLAALVVFAVVPVFFWMRSLDGRPFGWSNLALGGLIGASYLIGVLLVRMHLPAYLQPAHLVLATMVLGIIVMMLTASKPEAKEPTLNSEAV
jgi:cytochrome c oxidase assembly protein subunit 15